MRETKSVKVFNVGMILKPSKYKNPAELSGILDKRGKVYAKLLLHFFYDSLERLGVVHGQIGKNFSVELYTIGFYLAHKL